MPSAAEAANVLASALAEQDQNRRDRDHDITAQLGSLERAIKAENRLGDDRLETVMGRFDAVAKQLAAVDEKLTAIHALLTTNGSGRGHG